MEQWMAFYYMAAAVATSAMELYFFSGCTGASVKSVHYAGYACLAVAVFGAREAVDVPSIVSALAETVILTGFGCTAFKKGLIPSGVTSVLTVTVILLVNNCFDSVTYGAAVLFSDLEAVRRNPAWSLGMSIVVSLLALLSTFLTFRFILRRYPQKEEPGLVFLLPPVLLVLFISCLVAERIYGNELVFGADGRIKFLPGGEGEIVLTQAAAYICLLTTIYSYGKLSEHFRMAAKMTILEQQARTQQEYVREAEARLKQTRAFRHDWKNHLLVLNGYLQNGDLEHARSYCESLESLAAPASYSVLTGSPALDVLLGSKLGLARQNKIRTECSLRIPADSQIEDIDLCIVFSNAVDNAVHACLKAGEDRRFIRITGSRKGSFFLVEVENACQESAGRLKEGTGLANIRAVAGKYHGKAEIEADGGICRLHVLFIISGQKRDISDPVS